MNGNTLTVVAQVKAKPGHEGEMRKELTALITPSRKDAGCVNYDLHQDVSDPTSFLLHENWQSRELLEKHLATTHVQQALSRLTPMAASAPLITFWEKIG